METGAIKIPNLVIRLLSTLFLVPLALSMIWFGGWIFSAFVILGGLLVLHEWHSITGTGKTSLLAGGLVLVIASILCATGYVVFSLLLLLVGAGLLVLTSLAKRDSNGAWGGAGVFYVTLPVIALILLRSDAQSGFFAVTYVMIVVWVTDSAAYGAGRGIGGAKLWPAVSPNKTWAGLLGGGFGAACAGAAMGLLIPGSNPMYLAILGAVLALISQGGDLAESAIKRHFMVKDSGSILPGHGGIFDRVDGLISAAVFAALIGCWQGGFMQAATGLLF